jgi:hypothetical protein
MTAATTAADLSDVDRAALALAIEIVRNENAASRAQIDDKLQCEPWFAVAAFCAYGAQSTAPNLKPWECWPPCTVEPDDTDERGLEHRRIGKSAALLRRMLAAGLSRYEPDPINALGRAAGSPKKKRGPA